MANSTGLWLPDGTFRSMDAADAADLHIELATRRNAGVLGSVGLWLDMLPDPDPVLRKMGQESAILAELAADDQVTTAMLARKNRVLNCPHYGFRPGAPEGAAPSEQAVNLHKNFMADLERANLRGIISGILDAPFYGFTPLELLWEFANGWWHLKDIIPRPQHWFRFDVDNKPVFVGEYGGLCGMGGAQALPDKKFLFVTHHANYENPYGLRLLSRCLWPVTFKRGGLQFYAKFVERHGMPWVVGKAPVGNKVDPDTKHTMATDLAKMVQDCVAVIPSTAEVEFLSIDSAQSDLHEAFLARQDRAISKLLMGQTLTVEMEGKNNSQAAATTHGEVAEGLAHADKAMVADTFNELAWIYAQTNSPEARAGAIRAPLFAYEEPEDLNARADLDKKLCEMGVVFTNKHFEENYNLSKGEFTLASASVPTPYLPAAPTSFAAPAPSLMLAEQAQGILDTSLDMLLPDVREANAQFVSQVEKAVANAESFDDMQLALVELLAPRMAPSALEDILARTMTAAAGFGATAVQGETREDN